MLNVGSQVVATGSFKTDTANPKTIEVGYKGYVGIFGPPPSFLRVSHGI
jgi:hypothetical protein